jgi:chromosome segregation ATPase
MHLIKASMAGQLPFIPTSLPPPLDELACAGRSPSTNQATLIGSCPSGVPCEFIFISRVEEIGNDVYRAASIHYYLNNEPAAHPEPPCDQSQSRNDPERIKTVIRSLKPVHTGFQALEQSHSSRGAGYSSLVAKISNDQTQFDILNKSLVTTDVEREALARQGLDIQADNLLSLPTNMKDDQGQLEILNGALQVDIANAGFKAPTINQSTPAAEQSQIDTLNRLIDASNTAKEELTRAVATQEIELLSLSEKSRNDQGLIDALNVSLTTANSAYDGLRKVIASKATELTFLSTKTRNDQVQIDTLNRSLNAMEAEHQELRQAFASQEVELSSLSANSRNDQGQIDTLNQLLMTARTEQEELRQAFNSQATEFTSLSAKTRNDQVQIDSLKQSLDTAQVEQEELRRSFTSQATKLSSLTAKTKADESQLHNLARSLRKTREEREAVKRALVSRTDELSALSAETQDQRTQINALHTLLDTTTVERETLKKTLSAQAAELLHVRDELSSANAANAAGTSLLDELREQVNEQTEELRSASEALGRAENDLNTMRSERVRREIQIHTLQGEAAYLTPRNTKHQSRTHRPSRSAQSTNAVAGPSRTPSHHPTTYTRLHGTSLQPVRRHEQIQCLFECGICMDKKPVDDVTPLDPCRHQFCRDCVKNYIRCKIGRP